MPVVAGSSFIATTAPLLDIQAFYYTRMPNEGWTSVEQLPASAQAAVKSSLGGALGVAKSLPAAVGEPLAAAAKTAYVDGMRISLVAAAFTRSANSRTLVMAASLEG